MIRVRLEAQAPEGGVPRSVGTGEVDEALRQRLQGTLEARRREDPAAADVAFETAEGTHLALWEGGTLAVIRLATHLAALSWPGFEPLGE
ncbi:hypothetical protein VQH23_09965 [Pararoseomonas sp. SCSIO 73927]|uniref:hypothetical protein n=1 Tax=Pararoseomonas sp. SCSIO 73927 TaxID=3114537 RepID=UPI0030D4565E